MGLLLTTAGVVAAYVACGLMTLALPHLLGMTDMTFPRLDRETAGLLILFWPVVAPAVIFVGIVKVLGWIADRLGLIRP